MTAKIKIPKSGDKSRPSEIENEPANTPSKMRNEAKRQTRKTSDDLIHGSTAP